jgi:tetratricopeptide (TPR) repeat protein
MALQLIPRDPAESGAVSELEKLRVRVLLDSGKLADALSAAKAYYDTAPMKQTADAINTVADCLSAVHPDDADIAQRFKKQQVAGAIDPPVAAQGAQDLGVPILDTITIDPKPYEDAISKIRLSDYKSLAAKGNLLLASGQGSDARATFEQALDAAPAENTAEAIENVARSIRAETGRIAPANAYVLAKRDKDKGL